MKILLDEQVPYFFRKTLRLLFKQDIDHVHDLRWTSKNDIQLLADAKVRGYELFITNDRAQLTDPDETRAIKKSKIHHLCYDIKGQGLRASSNALAALVAALPHVIEVASLDNRQKLFRARSFDISRNARLEITDPRIDPPRYWRR